MIPFHLLPMPIFSNESIELNANSSSTQFHLKEELQAWLTELGINAQYVNSAIAVIKILGIILLCAFIHFLIKFYFLKLIQKLVLKSKVKWDDILIEKKVIQRILRIVPFMVLYNFADAFPMADTWLKKATLCIIAVLTLSTVDSILNSIIEYYRMIRSDNQGPIRGYVQTSKLIINIAGAIFIIAIIMDTSPGTIFAGLGAMTAVLMFVFKDSILGLLASIQISSNHLVRIGDWIEMPKYGIDGDVIDISLHTIKVQNWDKTIASIPSYALISDSFKNWRGMSESGGRRIKRAIHIDIGSIKFCDDTLKSKLSKFSLLKDYLQQKEEDIKNHNEKLQLDSGEMINGRHLTNIGTFRAYIVAYLKNNPKIHTEGMTFLVRQLPPGETGLPLEIYVFSNDQVWVNYEGIQSDIFDHLLAIVPQFDLKVFQNPTGQDFKSLVAVKP